MNTQNETKKNNGTIENTEQKSQFYSKKNSFLLCFFIILSIALLSSTFIFILKIDFNALFKTIRQNILLNENICWFFLLIIFLLFNLISPVFCLYIRCVEANIKISKWEWFKFGTIICFLRSVTPANIIYDPYTVFWLRKHNISIDKAASIMLFNTWLWQLLQIFVTLPSFIFVCCNLKNFLNNPEGKIAFSFACMGFILDFICLIVLTLLCCWKKMHYFLSITFNWLKKKFKLKYKTKTESYTKHIDKATMAKEFYEYIAQWKGTLLCALLIIITEIFIYVTTYASLKFVCNTSNQQQKIYINFIDIFNATNIVFTANKMLPLPGGVASLEWMLLEFITALNKVDLDSYILPTKEQISNSIIIWRTFYTYIPAIIGIFSFTNITIKQLKLFRNNENENKTE